jgi:thymidylate synthase
MNNYIQLALKVINEGTPRATRTGERAIGIFGEVLRFDMKEGFPILSTKYVNFDAVKGELIGFLRGFTSAAQFRELGCKVWDANANAPGLDGSPNAWLSNPRRKGEDDLGRIYGPQWRHWQKPANGTFDDVFGVLTGVKTEVDQIANLIQELRVNPMGRRHIVTAWNPGELDTMALPACHYAFQCYVEYDEGNPKNEPQLSMMVHMRSVDVFLGLPFNISSYALLLEMIAHVTGMKPNNLMFTLCDTHIYESHIPEVLVLSFGWPRREEVPEMFQEQEGKYKMHFDECGSLRPDAVRMRPKDRNDENYFPRFTDIDTIAPHNIQLNGYEPQGALKGKMAV